MDLCNQCSVGIDNHCGGLPQCQYSMSRVCPPPARRVQQWRSSASQSTSTPCASAPLAGEDFERVERELHERFVEAEREVLGELLERLDVDAPSVALGGRRYHRVLRSTESYTTAVGPVTAERTLYRVRARTRGGPDGASRRDCRGALDGAGGTAGELRGGADDAERGRGAAARARQHGAVEELARPACPRGSVRAGRRTAKGSNRRCARRWWCPKRR